ncbi:MAG: hypothetical protein V1874_00845 [Spirochaetota bacterium]
MLSLKKSKKDIPDLTEFTDDEGRKWIQTSADDLFASSEFHDILDKIEKDKSKDEIILAKFDFRKVNKEYHETILDLQARQKKQNEILKKLLIDAKDTIDKKNAKLKELVKYIRKIHLLLAYYKTNPEKIEELIPSPDTVFYELVSAVEEPEKTEAGGEIVKETVKTVIKYTDVDEILLDDEGNEKG